MNLIGKLEKLLGNNKLKLNESLVSYSTLKVGGPAKFFIKASTVEDLIKSVQTAIHLKVPYLVLGGGSNVVISDKGFNGLVIRNEARHISIVKRIGKVRRGHTDLSQAVVEADAGVLINQLVRFTCDEGLTGLERHLGLPGTVGGALYMNSKWTKPATYVGDAVYKAKLLDKQGNIKIVEQYYFHFGYDQSIIQKTEEVVVSVMFLLKRQDKELLWKHAHESMAYRRQSQPMGVASAGCSFRNITLADAIRIGTPNHTTSAGYLVDQVGLKNFSIGKAKFSDIHANFIINTGGAKADDIKALVEEAKVRVKVRFAVKLEPEIVFIGD